MPQSTKTEQRGDLCGGRLLAMAGLLGVLTMGMVACGPASDLAIEPEVDSWPLRDLLAVDEARQDWTASEREVFVERALEASALDRGLDRDASAPSTVEGADLSFPADPLGAIARMDLARYERGEDVRLFGVFWQESEGAASAPCELEPDELVDDAGRPRRIAALDGEDWPAGWRAAGSWSEEHPEELERLSGLAPALVRWAERCGVSASEAGEAAVAEGLRVFQREPHAPYLLAWWPQRRKLYVHPLLIDLFGVEAPAEEAGLVRTRAQGLATNSVAACVEELGNICDQCGTQDAAAANPQVCQNLFPDSTVFSDCATLRGQVPNGLEVYCIYRIFQGRPSVESCVQNSVGSTCDRQTLAVNSVSTLVQAYDQYLDVNFGPICRQEAAGCADPDSVDPVNNGVNNDPGMMEPGPEPPPVDLEEPGCGDDFFLCVWAEDCGNNEDNADKEYNNGCSLCGEKDPEASSSSDEGGCCE